jgi:hypothetical protein
MAADKIVPSASPLAWENPSPTQILWRGPVEVDSIQRGMVTLYVNPTFPRSWSFKLSLHRDEIYRVDVKMPPARHSNPPTRPAGYPRLVTSLEHEHCWVEGLGLRCARPLEGLSDADHQRILDEFCKRARIDFRPEYSEPTDGVQLEL